MRTMRKRRREAASDDDRILPLINIVFLLLIFFMVVGRLSAGDPFEIEPMRSASDGAPASEPMLIAIGPEGQLALNGAMMGEDDLMAALQPGDDGIIPPVRIKSDGRVQAAMVVALLDRLRLAGIGSVKLMTVPERAERGVGAVSDGVSGVGTAE